MPAEPSAGGPSDDAKPGVGAVLGHGWETLTRHFWTLIVATLIYLGAEALSNVFTIDPGPGGPQSPVSVLSPLWSILITGPLFVGLAALVLTAVRGREPELDELLTGFRTYVNAVGGMLVYSIAVVVGLILLVVPGLVAIVRLSFTPYLIADRDLDPIDAVKTSWERTRGHGWPLFGLLIVSLGILVVGLLLLIVGVVPAIAWVTAAWATYYDRVTSGPAPTGEQAPTGSEPERRDRSRGEGQSRPPG